MEGRCERHQFDGVVDNCLRCGLGFCRPCLVYPYGTAKPPFCLPCAVNAAGLRHGSGSGKPISRRERKKLERERAARAAVVPARTSADDADKFDMDWLKQAPTPS